jgi:hypothetical protein
MTDPSGYFFKWAAKKLLGKAGARIAGFGVGGFLGSAIGNWAYGRAMNSQGIGAVVGVALNFIPGCQVWCSALFSAQRTYHATGSLSAAFHAGGQTAAIAGVFYGIGQGFEGTAYANGPLHVAAHAVAGGVIADLQGGKFGHGFFSAGFTKFAMGNAGFNYNDISSSAIAGRVAIAAVIGGTSSAISGGKFANGATTAAMAQLFNAEASNNRAKARQQRAARAKEVARKAGGRFDSIDELKANMRPGELRFGIRPLGDEAKYSLWLVNSLAGDWTNLSLVHEHVVYMDDNGQLQDIGFTGSDSGVAQDTNFEGRIGSYKWGPIQQVDLSNINFHSMDFQSSNYHIVTNNCQDYCSFIRKQL